MRTLFLDLASHDGRIACVADSAVVSLRSVHPKTSDRELAQLYESMLVDATWTPSAIQRIACVTGPGGFTSLRVAAAFANALSYALGVPSAGIHLSDLKAACSLESDAYWLHSTKKNDLFIRGFGAHASLMQEPQCIELHALNQFVGAGEVWIGELIPEHRAVADQLGLKEGPRKDIADILPSLLLSLTYEKQRIDPWYGRGW